MFVPGGDGAHADVEWVGLTDTAPATCPDRSRDSLLPMIVTDVVEGRVGLVRRRPWRKLSDVQGSLFGGAVRTDEILGH